MKSTISAKTYKAIYRLLDRVSPVDFDCGSLCGSICCTCEYKPENMDPSEYTAASDVNAGEYMGLYLLPGEETVHLDTSGSLSVESSKWLDWGHIMAEDYTFPESWNGKVYFIRCHGPEKCNRSMRPIQCRTFPLAPHIDESGEFHLILDCDDLPYECPVLEQAYEGVSLNGRFIQATYTVWKHLILDPYIYDLVKEDSAMLIKDNAEIVIVI